MKRINVKLLALTMLVVASGCITVGVEPKKEIRQREETIHAKNVGLRDGFSKTILSLDWPSVSVSKGDDKSVRIEIKAGQRLHQRETIAQHRETWEIGDGTALSIGLFPGYGRFIYEPYYYHFHGKAVGVVLFPIQATFCNIIPLPTLSGLFCVPFVNNANDDNMSDMALLGCNRFRTGKSPSVQKMRDKIELFSTEDRSCGFTAQMIEQGIDAVIVASVEIPSLWFKKSFIIQPKYWGGNVHSYAVVDFPTALSPNTIGMVSLSFIDTNDKYGVLLKPYEGMIAKFSL